MAKNPETRITFRAFNKDFNKAIGEMKNESTKLRQEFKLQEAQMEGTASETDKLQLKLDYLGKAYDQAAQKTKATADQLEKAKAQFGENSTEAGKMERKLLDAQIAEQKLKNEINTTSKALQEQANTIKKTADAIGKAGEKMKDAGAAASTTVMPAIAGIGLAAGKVASDFDSAAASLKNSLGLTKEETEALTETARQIYTDGYGESLTEVENAIIQTRQNVKGLNEEDLSQITTYAMLLADTFEADVNEVTRAGSNVMEGFGISAQDAFDLMGYGAQNGLNFSNEMFDNLSEYAPLFSRMGFSAEEYFQLLINGSQEGVYNLDYINDVMKEFQIRIKDGSKSTVDAMDQMSESTQKVWQSFLNGDATVKDVSNAVLGELKGMDDQVEANNIGVALFGTKWEDLEADAMYALGGIDGKLGDFSGTMNDMQATQEATFGQRFKMLIRDLLTSLQPLGEALIKLAEDWMPRISAAAQTLANWFTALSPILQSVIVIFGGIMAVLGPFLMILGSIVQGFAVFIPAIMKVVSWVGRLAPLFTYLRTALALLSGPIGWISIAVIGLATLIYKYWDQIAAYTQTAWSAVGQWLSSVWSTIKSVVIAAAAIVVSTVTSRFNAARNAIQNTMNTARSIVSAVWSAIRSVVISAAQAVVSAVTSRFNAVRSAIQNAMNTARSVVSNAWDTIKSVSTSAPSAIVSVVTSKFQQLVSAARNKMNEVLSAIRNGWDSAKSFLSGIDLSSIGADIINGLVNGIKSKVGAVGAAIQEVAGSVKSKITGALGIKSPSRVMMEYGENTSEGFAIGIERMKGLVQKAAQTLTVMATPMSEMSLSQRSGESIAAAQASRTINHRTTVNLDGRTIADVITPFVDENMQDTVDIEKMLGRA